MLVNESGVTPTDLAGYKAELEAGFRSALGEALSIAPDSPQGQIIGILSTGFALQDEAGVSVSNGLSLYQAAGFQLDALGSLVQLDRIRGERSVVDATLTGTDGTVLAAGTRALTTDGAVFLLAEGTTIPAAGTVLASFRSEEFGPVPAPAASLTRMGEAVTGWTAITNIAAASLGRLAENDAEYRERYESELLVRGRDGNQYIRAQVLGQEGVQDCRVEDNDTAATITIQTLDIAARSVLVVVDGGSEADIGAAIFRSKPAGTPTVGGTSVQVPHAQGRTRAVNYTKVVAAPIAIEVTIRTVSGFPSDGLTLIPQRCVEWVAGEFIAVPGTFDTGGLAIGETLDTMRVLTPINSVPGHQVTALDVTLESGGTLPTVLALNNRHTLAVADVTVTVVV